MLSELHVTTTTGDANNTARVKNYFQYLNVIATVSHACLCAMATRLFTYSIDQKVDYERVESLGHLNNLLMIVTQPETRPFFLQGRPKAGLNVGMGQ